MSLRLTRPAATAGELRALVAQLDEQRIPDDATVHAKTRLAFDPVGAPVRSLTVSTTDQ